ncbi:HupE/UreJ family protein [Pseudoteredinibacter isoporae]|uniref:Hydrogenase/urease accessory protein HupE n=1 Tax=Pseudoteredinibacter isoporae TaxID=570281 RepID=A0A7X0JS92_9GAMM|nr:HupE/UreJ family protein [Pseudoteredinibacter isoporae]MBB6520874.1 hydrogenase/urease accessory protein HupE [Pseudoteredinibacter isoporae]NHO86439.1 HupE/UreJ family protein [Pseudoteredinibacter isoporae]NIB25109.1 HupE/UreJ family protein [Pseudoteredinibacter isoporae]
MPWQIKRIQYLLLFCVLSFSALLQAHESRPFYIDIRETKAGEFSLLARVPESVPAFNRPKIELPDFCQYQQPGQASSRMFSCSQGIEGAELAIVYPLVNPSISTLIRLQRANGQIHNARLGPKQSHWQVPALEERWVLAKDYTILGIEHILIGLDHLLFLACLVFIAGGWRRILITVTGFTIAHSITLAAAALGVIRLPVPAIEAVIALSIIFLARELVLNRRDTLTWRHPVFVASSFGLLHGFGFAAVLADIGLPQTELPVALLFFNIGVELGQLFFVCIAALLFAVLRRLFNDMANLHQQGQFFSACAVGVLASFWFFERIAGF